MSSFFFLSYWPFSFFLWWRRWCRYILNLFYYLFLLFNNLNSFLLLFFTLTFSTTLSITFPRSRLRWWLLLWLIKGRIDLHCRRCLYTLFTLWIRNRLMTLAYWRSYFLASLSLATHRCLSWLLEGILLLKPWLLWLSYLIIHLMAYPGSNLRMSRKQVPTLLRRGRT